MRLLMWIAVLVVLLTVGLSTGLTPTDYADAGTCSSEAGGWSGLFHGFLLFWTFLASLFWDGVGVYEVCNSGGWYNFGYVVGVWIAWRTSSSSRSSSDDD